MREKKTNKPSSSQVKAEENIKRLQDATEDMELVLVFSLEYKDIFQKQVLLGNKGVKNIVYSRHLSLQSINQIDKDVSNENIEENSEGNLKRRLKVIAKEIIEQFKGEEA